MGSLTLIILSIGLAMDAFAVSVSDGICYRRMGWKGALLIAFTFGFFQAGMPLLGFLAGQTVSEAIESVDHWIALILLVFIGGNMLREGVKGLRSPEEIERREYCTARELLLQGIATSIDALAVGVSFAVMKTNIWTAALSIGIITFICSLCGVGIGKRFGGALKEKAEICGGLILIGIGLKIFLEHMLGL